MHWTIAASFFSEDTIGTSRWLDDFVTGGHSFTKIPRRGRFASWHDRKSRNTQVAEWQSFWHQIQEACQTTTGGMITVFPQPAAMAGVRKKLTRSSMPVIAWCFNIGACYGGWKQLVAQQALQNIDRFIVHSRHECQVLSQWLNLPLERFQFVPLQRAPILITETEEQEQPFLLALGSANRDYKTFFAAVAQLNIRTLVVASHHAVQNLNIPANVELLSGLSPADCHRLAQRARATIVPLELTQTASGQVTVVESMRMARPVIATRCPGTIDYIQHNQTGLLVQPYSVQELSDTIAHLWSDAELRAHLGNSASTYAETHLSDPAAGAALKQVLDQFG